MEPAEIATREEVEALKLEWANDPCYPLDSFKEGDKFYPYLEELRQFEESQGKRWVWLDHLEEDGLIAIPCEDGVEIIRPSSIARIGAGYVWLDSAGFIKIDDSNRELIRQLVRDIGVMEVVLAQ